MGNDSDQQSCQQTAISPAESATERNFRWYDLWPIALVLAIFGCYTYLVAKKYGLFPGDVAGSGQVGDTFGVLTSLFNGLAFAGLIIAILLQSRELSLQRSELKLTRREMAGQNKQLEYQSFALAKQNFEATFFRLLQFIDDRASQLPDAQVTAPSQRGRSGFQRHVDQWKKYESGAILDSKTTKERASKMYRAWIGGAAPELASYFQLILEALRLIDQTQVSINKQSYANILRAALSPQEKHLLVYHGLFDLSAQEYAVLLMRYRIFDRIELHMPAEILEIHLGWYPQTV